MNRRTYERIDISSEVVIDYNSKKIPCEIINISGSGVCFVVDKKNKEDIAGWDKGVELKFEFISNHDGEDEITPQYMCTIMHIEEQDDKYQIGASVAEEVSLK